MSKKKKIAFLSGFLSLKWEHTYRETVGYIEKKESCWFAILEIEYFLAGAGWYFS